MKRKDIGLGNIEGPYPAAFNSQGGAMGTIYAPCKIIVMLSCLVWKIQSPLFVYTFLYEAKSHRARIGQKSLPRALRCSGLSLLDNLHPQFKYSDVVLFSLGPRFPHFHVNVLI